MKMFYIEEMAARYNHGDLVKEFLERLEQQARWEMVKEDLTVTRAPGELVIAIDGTKPSFLASDADGLEFLNEDDVLGLLKFCLFTHCSLNIKSAKNKNLTVEFWWMD